MNRRALIISVLTIAAAALVWCAYAQQQQLADLRAQEKQLLQQAASRNTAPATPAERSAVSPELLRLRSEITQLAARRQELATVRTENESLKARIAGRANNGRQKLTPINLHIQMNQAQFTGYATPEDTIQSLLWAMQNRDFHSFTQAFSPDILQHLIESTKDPDGKDFFEHGADKVTGVTIFSRTEMPDGSIELETQADDEGDSEKMRFYQINGQWKVGEPAQPNTNPSDQ